MATKPEETSAATAEGAGLFGGPSSEKQPESISAPATTTTDAAPVEKSPAEDATTTSSPPATEERVEPNTAEERCLRSYTRSYNDRYRCPHHRPNLARPPADHPLAKFYDIFETLVTEASHDEVYGIPLSKNNEFHTKLILQKFLRGNQNDVEKAKQQLLETLKWRKEFDPVKAAGEQFDKARFDGLGYVLQVEDVPESANKKDVVTFNIYGAVKDNKATFGDLESFLRWRVGLMEKSVQALNLPAATLPIPDYNAGPDPYQGFQIHDYLQVSFLRRDPAVKAATSKTIETLGRYYPETLSRKFFVNVPVVMGWVYTAIKMVVAKETAKKFTVLSYGNQLATELGPNVPQVYGGKAGGLAEIGEGMALKE